MFSRILLASDGSGDANQAATAAASLAERFGAQMHILHVFSLLPPDSARTDVSPFHDQSSILQGVVERWAEKSADEVGHRIKRALSSYDIPYTFHQENGDPAAVIVQVAEREGFDLIVIGCRGLGPALRDRLGSVSDWVSHHAPCPVLIVRPLRSLLEPATAKPAVRALQSA